MVSQTAHHSVAPAVFRDVLQRLTSDCICMGFIFVAVVNLVKASGAYTLTPAFAEFFWRPFELRYTVCNCRCRHLKLLSPIGQMMVGHAGDPLLPTRMAQIPIR